MQAFLGELVSRPSPSLKTPVWEARGVVGRLRYLKDASSPSTSLFPRYFPLFLFLLLANFFCSSALIKEPGTGYVLKNTNKVVG